MQAPNTNLSVYKLSLIHAFTPSLEIKGLVTMTLSVPIKKNGNKARQTLKK